MQLKRVAQWYLGKQCICLLELEVFIWVSCIRKHSCIMCFVGTTEAS